MLLWTKVTDKIPGSLVAIVVTHCNRLFCKTSGQHHWKCVWKTEFCFSFFPCSIYYHEPDTADDLTGIYHCCFAAIESLLSAVVSDGMIGDTHKSNAELIGQGLGNIFSGFFGGIPCDRCNRQNCCQCPQWRTDSDCRNRTLYYTYNHSSGTDATLPP